MQQPELNPNYLSGHEPEEVRRLVCQAAMHQRFTERLLHCAQIEPGQRVLDAGSGPGDVTMRPVKLMGPTLRQFTLEPGSLPWLVRNDEPNKRLYSCEMEANTQLLTFCQEDNTIVESNGT
jgi:hypothetical protein